MQLCVAVQTMLWEGWGAGNKTAVPHLILLLKDSDATVRSRAANALGRYGCTELKMALP